MRYLALCCDYDGTLAEDGTVSDATQHALQRVRASGRKILLVTGRKLDDLQGVCNCLDLFDRVVAENGAVLYNPATRERRLLSEGPPHLFIQTLRQRGVRPLSLGQVVVAAWHPHETIVLQTIRDLNLGLQVTFNKDAVMVLPAGVNKASGLMVALQELNLSRHNIIGIGDAENDHAFLAACEIGVAVANALPLLKDAADFVTAEARGRGVLELVAELLKGDMRPRESQLTRHRVLLGRRESGEEILLRAHDFQALLVGTSGGGKSRVATGLLERLAAQKYNFCVIDPEGDYANVESAITLGTPTQAPTQEQARQLLNTYDTNAVINLVALKPEDRPAFFQALLTSIQEARLRTGRPHWLLVDEAQHLLPARPASAGQPPSISLEGVLLISVHPKLIAPSALEAITSVLAIGTEPQTALEEFRAIAGIAAPPQVKVNLQNGEALYWSISPLQAPEKITMPA
jgi:hydroxymethylpyrimidine pyrophosphatase-like HAD family hydrolase